MKPILLLASVVFLLAGCAAKPSRTNDACAILDQKNGLFVNWGRAAKAAERDWGVPMPIILATINVESGFQHNARPARKKWFGFIPGKRPSTAYGYAQALDGTWDEYRRDSGRPAARRNNFADAAGFIGWYHHQTMRKNGVAADDAYNLYLNYYLGHAGYARGGASDNATAKRGAQRMQTLAQQYDRQLRQCLKYEPVFGKRSSNIRISDI